MAVGFVGAFCQVVREPSAAYASWEPVGVPAQLAAFVQAEKLGVDEAIIYDDGRVSL